MELTVPVPGGELWAEDTGGAGTPLVLVHGDWTDSGIWSPLTRLLRDRYRVIRYDLRGFGRSSRPVDPFTRLDDLLAVLDHRDVARAVVVGHSGGGGPALGLALAAPERVSELILIAPGVHDYPWPQDDRYFREASSLIKAGDQDGLVRLGLRTGHRRGQMRR
jgi:3-oxoadipate enol-lactonase